MQRIEEIRRKLLHIEERSKQRKRKIDIFIRILVNLCRFIVFEIILSASFSASACTGPTVKQILSIVTAFAAAMSGVINEITYNLYRRSERLKDMIATVSMAKVQLMKLVEAVRDGDDVSGKRYRAVMESLSNMLVEVGINDRKQAAE